MGRDGIRRLYLGAKSKRTWCAPMDGKWMAIKTMILTRKFGMPG